MRDGEPGVASKLKKKQKVIKDAAIERWTFSCLPILYLMGKKFFVQISHSPHIELELIRFRSNKFLARTGKMLKIGENWYTQQSLYRRYVIASTSYIWLMKACWMRNIFSCFRWQNNCQLLIHFSCAAHTYRIKIFASFIGRGRANERIGWQFSRSNFQISRPRRCAFHASLTGCTPLTFCHVSRVTVLLNLWKQINHPSSSYLPAPACLWRPKAKQINKKKTKQTKSSPSTSFATKTASKQQQQIVARRANKQTNEYTSIYRNVTCKCNHIIVNVDLLTLDDVWH